ncbi:hypothetical protein TNCV_3863151 [Trichonephila clavipes]|uniref:Uncharacterized protein n=1 Tax=Trichonephila clavipes TaxID=2585209 RepID=A0A8X6S3X6_TRICX|nr:hypothetical protein TNCV_3863151 [Trichonephila clavipes]
MCDATVWQNVVFRDESRFVLGAQQPPTPAQEDKHVGRLALLDHIVTSLILCQACLQRDKYTHGQCDDFGEAWTIRMVTIIVDSLVTAE